MKCRLLTPDEFNLAEDQRMSLARRRGADPEWLAANKAEYGWARLDEITGPCVMWFAPWLFDPTDPQHKGRRNKALADIAAGSKTKFYLSKFYWRDWSDKRPPIGVLTPNGKEWLVDAVSQNGEGWVVTGEAPDITCQPSISMPGYHGFLTNGEFSGSI